MDNLLSRLRALAKEEQDESGTPDELRAPLSYAQREEIASAVLAIRPPAGARVTSLATRFRRRAWIMFTLPVAAAAAFVLVSRSGFDPNGRWPALPAYEVDARGGIKELRHGESASPGTPGATARPARLGLESELVVGCRPASSVEGPVAARAFVSREGIAGAPVEIASRIETASTGALEIRLRPFAGVAATVDPSGPIRWTLRIAVGRPARVAKLAASEMAAPAPADEPALRWLTVPLDLVAN